MASSQHGLGGLRIGDPADVDVGHVDLAPTFCRIADVGDVPISSAFDLEGSHANITAFYRQVHAAGAVPLSFGTSSSLRKIRG